MDFNNYTSKFDKLFDQNINGCDTKLVDDISINTEDCESFFNIGRYENCINYDNNNKINNILNNNKNLEQHILEFSEALNLLENIIQNKNIIKESLSKFNPSFAPKFNSAFSVK